METSNRGILLVLVEESKKRHIRKESSKVCNMFLHEPTFHYSFGLLTM